MEKESKPEEKYNISGKGLTCEDKEEIDYVLRKEKHAGLQPIEGEIRKTPEQLKIIQRVNEHLNQEFGELNIKKESNILPEQIHFLPASVYKKKFPDEKSPAFNLMPSHAIIMDLSRHSSRTTLYGSTLHEIIHSISAERYHVFDEKYSIQQGRMGYLDINEKEEHEHFLGFNEIVVDKLVCELIQKHDEELMEEFKFSQVERESGIWGYNKTVLNLIIDIVATYKKEKPEDVWKRFKKGLFSGEMMHLRDIEKVFGKGSLRVIAALSFDTKEGIDNKEIHDKIIDYLVTNNEEKKEEIAKEILIDREYSAYKKQRGK